MTDITIPPEAVEAAARAAMKDNGCGHTVNGLHVLCDDPVCDGLFDPYGKPMKHECSCRSMAIAAIRAALAAWPDATILETVPLMSILLPLPQEKTDG